MAKPARAIANIDKAKAANVIKEPALDEGPLGGGALWLCFDALACGGGVWSADFSNASPSIVSLSIVSPILADGCFDFAIMLFAEPYLLFACRERIRSLTKPISANHIPANHIRTDHIIAA
jgi:hypothetical protein